MNSLIVHPQVALSRINSVRVVLDVFNHMARMSM